MVGPAGPSGEPFRREGLTLETADARLAGVDLSDRFGPFLVRFAREAIRSGGRAVVALEEGRVVGLALSDPTETTASVFTRSAAVAAALRREQDGTSVYAEVDLGGPRELFGVHRVELGEEPAHRFRHAVRLLHASELAAAGALLREVYGSSAEGWLRVSAAEGERGFGVEVDGTLAGVAWALAVGRHARLHTLTVRTGFRRMGIGSDLLFARLLYARDAGACEAISEISERNAASRAVAERAGMRVAGTVFLYPPASGGAGAGGTGPFAGGTPTSA